MKSLFSAHQAYERRVIQIGLDNTKGKTLKRPVPREPLVVQSSDLVIPAGLQLKRHHSRKSGNWSPITGVNP